MKLGCNYWASNAGAEMWRDFDEVVIRKDISLLSGYGVKYLRVFPNWRDFQPVEPYFQASGRFKEYRMNNGQLPTNEYFLDEEMLDRFDLFCNICQDYGIKLIVGLLTGWMSGRTFIPIALYEKNLYTDSICQYFEQLYVTGLVERFKDKEVIYAWNHGNESGVLGNPGNPIAADAWARMISNAIYSVDKSRPLLTGQHYLSLDGVWRIQGQAAVCDMLVAHPYPYWGRHTSNDKNDYIKTTLYSAAISKMYMDIGKKPCLIEEIGTMGPSICSEEFAEKFLRVNYFSTMANGAEGIMWWCAHEQDKLMTPPYTWTNCENELGMTYTDGTPKPVLKEMQRLSKLDINLPKANCDAICLLTEGQDNWGIAYMTYVLSKQAGLNISFADAKDEIPENDVYMLPSIKGANIMPKERLIELKQKIYDGAKLYISNDGGLLMGFEKLTGNKILDTENTSFIGEITINGKNIPYSGNSKLYFENTRATQIDTPYITFANYGKGKVYFVNFPVEAMLIDKNRAFSNNVCEIYKRIFKDELESRIIKIDNDDVALTIHPAGEKIFAVVVNHSEKIQRIDFKTKYKLSNIVYGDLNACEPQDAVIAEFIE